MVNNLIDFIKDADFFRLDDIKDEAIQILVSNLVSNPLKSVEAYHLSDLCNSLLLKGSSQKTILQNIGIVSETSDFLKLDIESLKDILSSNPSICSTGKIFEGVLRWIVEDLEVRKSHLMDILRLIQFGCIDSNKIIKIATDGNILSGSVEHM